MRAAPYLFAGPAGLFTMSTQEPPSSERAPGASPRFLAVFEPIRPELYRYCRYLTRSAWDAEDLVQDALARAFVSLASTAELPDNPRAWLFKVASNAWLNRIARKGELLQQTPEPNSAPEARAKREAAGTLLGLLSPQERAAVVLKDAFEFSLEEIAQALETSVGAVKTALHRGRGKLALPEPERAASVHPQVLDDFCAAFDAGDLERLTALLLDDAIVAMPGILIERGAAAARAGTFRGTLEGCAENDAQLGLVGPPRCEVRNYRGEPILVWFWGGTVRTLLRVDTHAGRIARITNYFHAPELLSEICAELGLPVRTNGYRPLAGDAA